MICGENPVPSRRVLNGYPGLSVLLLASPSSLPGEGAPATTTALRCEDKSFIRPAARSPVSSLVESRVGDLRAAALLVVCSAPRMSHGPWKLLLASRVSDFCLEHRRPSTKTHTILPFATRDAETAFAPWTGAAFVRRWTGYYCAPR